MPGPRWRSAAAGWLRQAADSLSPSPEVSATDHPPYDGGHLAPDAAAAGSRRFDLGEAPEHWVKLLRDAGLVAGGHGVGKAGPTTPADDDSAGPASVPLASSAQAGSGEAGSLRADAADAGNAAAYGQAARAEGAGAGGHHPRANGGRRIPRLLIGRRTATSQPVLREHAANGQAASPHAADPQAARAGSASDTGTAHISRLGAEAVPKEGQGMTRPGSLPGPTPPGSGEPALTSGSHRHSARRAAPTLASNTNQPARQPLPNASPPEPSAPELPGAAGLTVPPGLSRQEGLSGEFGTSGPQRLSERSVRSGLWRLAWSPERFSSAAAPSGEGTVQTGPAAVVVPEGQTAPKQPAQNRAHPERPLDGAGVQYPALGPAARNLPSALAGEWPELPVIHAAPATEAAPKIEQALTRNLRLRDEQQAV